MVRKQTSVVEGPSWQDRSAGDHQELVEDRTKHIVDHQDSHILVVATHVRLVLSQGCLLANGSAVPQKSCFATLTHLLGISDGFTLLSAQVVFVRILIGGVRDRHCSYLCGTSWLTLIPKGRRSKDFVSVLMQTRIMIIQNEMDKTSVEEGKDTRRRLLILPKVRLRH